MLHCSPTDVLNKNLKSVEPYDRHNNKQSSMSNMVVYKSSHSSFSIGNKMFVIDIEYDNCCEVYDSISRRFAILNFFIPRKGYDYDLYWSLNIGKKYLFFTICINMVTNLDCTFTTWKS